jgi:hypothetical protein
MRKFVQKKVNRAKTTPLMVSAEMEFLDINLTKDPGLLLHAIYSLLYLADFTENQTLFWFSKSIQKICETRNLKLIHE